MDVNGDGDVPWTTGSCQGQMLRFPCSAFERSTSTSVLSSSLFRPRPRRRDVAVAVAVAVAAHVHVNVNVNVTYPRRPGLDRTKLRLSTTVT